MFPLCKSLSRCSPKHHTSCYICRQSSICPVFQLKEMLYKKRKAATHPTWVPRHVSRCVPCPCWPMRWNKKSNVELKKGTPTINNAKLSLPEAPLCLKSWLLKWTHVVDVVEMKLLWILTSKTFSMQNVTSQFYQLSLSFPLSNQHASQMYSIHFVCANA